MRRVCLDVTAEESFSSSLLTPHKILSVECENVSGAQQTHNLFFLINVMSYSCDAVWSGKKKVFMTSNVICSIFISGNSCDFSTNKKKNVIMIVFLFFFLVCLFFANPKRCAGCVWAAWTHTGIIMTSVTVNADRYIFENELCYRSNVLPTENGCVPSLIVTVPDISLLQPKMRPVTVTQS